MNSRTHKVSLKSARNYTFVIFMALLIKRCYLVLFSMVIINIMKNKDTDKSGSSVVCYPHDLESNQSSITRGRMPPLQSAFLHLFKVVDML